MSNNSKKAYAYIRCNVYDETRICEQRRQICEYCKRNKIKLAEIFIDMGFSGSNFDRPAFNELLKCIERDEVDTIIVTDLARIGRDLRMSSYYIENYFPERNIRFIAINDNYDSKNDDSFDSLVEFQNVMQSMFLPKQHKKFKLQQHETTFT